MNREEVSWRREGKARKMEEEGTQEGRGSLRYIRNSRIFYATCSMYK